MKARRTGKFIEKNLFSLTSPLTFILIIATFPLVWLSNWASRQQYPDE